MTGLCSSRAQWPLGPNFCSQATRKSQFSHKNQMLGTLDFTGSQCWAPLNFPQSTASYELDPRLPSQEIKGKLNQKNFLALQFPADQKHIPGKLKLRKNFNWFYYRPGPSFLKANIIVNQLLLKCNPSSCFFCSKAFFYYFKPAVLSVQSTNCGQQELLYFIYLLLNYFNLNLLSTVKLALSDPVYIKSLLSIIY